MIEEVSSGQVSIRVFRPNHDLAMHISFTLGISDF